MNNEFDMDLGEDSPPQELLAVEPEKDRANWPAIHIEEEEGKPNYEYVAAHGTHKDGTPFSHEMQIMRGVDVAVPPSIVHNLRDAVSAQYSQRRDPETGRAMLRRHNRSAIPWRLIKPGKYIK